MDAYVRDGTDCREPHDSARWHRTLVLVGAAAFGVTLAMILGGRLGESAASVIVGAVVGVAATIPVTLILLALLTGRWLAAPPDLNVLPVGAHQGWPQAAGPRRVGSPAGDAGSIAYPRMPVIVVTPAGIRNWPDDVHPPAHRSSVVPVLPPVPRELDVIGDPSYYLDEQEWDADEW